MEICSYILRVNVKLYFGILKQVKFCITLPYCFFVTVGESRQSLLSKLSEEFIF